VLHRGRAHRLAQRVLGVPLDRRGQLQHLLDGQAVERRHVGDLRAALGEGAGLVEQHHVGAGQQFQVFAALDQQAAAGGGADGRQHRDRRGQGDGTGAGHHQHRSRRHGVAAQDQHQQGQPGHHRQIVAAELVGQTLVAAAVGLGVFHHAHHAAKGRLRADARGAHAQAAQLGDGRRVDVAAGAHLHRQRLAGDGGLVDRGLAAHHLAVHGNLFAGAHDHQVARQDGGNGRLHFDTVALDARGLGRQGFQVLHRAARALRGGFLDGVADAHEEDDHRGSGPLAHGQRRNHTQAHQRVGGDLAVECRTHDIAKDRIAEDQHQQCAGPEGHGICDAFEQPQPLARDDHKEHRAEDQPQQRQHAAGEVALRRGGRTAGRGAPHGVARALHRAADIVARHTRRVQVDHRFLRAEQHIDLGDAGQAGDGMADMRGALATVHAADGHFDGGEFAHGTDPILPAKQRLQVNLTT